MGEKPEIKSKVYLSLSHAAAYAYVSYQTAWLKYHYPAEYLCALFRCKDQDKFAPIIADCNMYGIEILPPDINSCSYDFTVENGNIRYGVSGIKGVGEASENTVRRICEEREKNGRYTSFQDFLKRTTEYDGEKYSPIQNELLMLFADVGMFDSLGCGRESLRKAIEEYSLGDSVDSLEEFFDKVEALAIDSCTDRAYDLKKEAELLGTICSERPLTVYGNDDFYGYTKIAELENDQRASVFGFVTSASKGVTSNKKKKLVVSLQGKTGECVAQFFGYAYNLYADDIDRYINKVVCISGDMRYGKLFGTEMTILPTPHPTARYIDLANLEVQEKLMQGGKILKERQNDNDVQLHLKIYFYRNGRPMEEPQVLVRWCAAADLSEILSAST